MDRALLKIVRARLVMSREIFCPISMVIVGFALSLKAAPAPTPTPAPKKSFFSAFKPRANPSATAARTDVAVGRGARLGVDRGTQTPIPRPTPTPKPKSKSSTTGQRKSSTPTPSKAQKSATPGNGSTPTSTPSASPTSTPTSTAASDSVTSSPTPPPSTTSTPVRTPTPTPAATPKSTPTQSPVSPPTKIELTLTTFEPPHGSPGERDYRNAQLSFRINVPKRMEYPVINFTVETRTGRIFERVFR